MSTPSRSIAFIVGPVLSNGVFRALDVGYSTLDEALNAAKNDYPHAHGVMPASVRQYPDPSASDQMMIESTTPGKPNVLYRVLEAEWPSVLS